jgi:hypothetical protein
MTAIDQDTAPPLPTFSTPAEAHPAGGNGLQASIATSSAPSAT